MDDQLKALIDADADTRLKGSDGTAVLDIQIQFVDDVSGEVELLRHDSDAPPRRYMLKPLAELYGQGSPDEKLDPQSHTFGPLFMCIEEEFVRTDRAESGLTDGDVRLAIDLLAMNPEGDVQHHTLARRVQLGLRLLLSVNNYSRDEVRRALRKIGKSVDRHSRLGGRCGYLDFIGQHMR